METLISVIIGVAVTFFFLRRYLKNMAPTKQASETNLHVHETEKTIACPRCSKPVGVSAAFCPACGVPLALWNVHRAPVEANPSTGAGKPQPVINASLCIGCGSCVDSCPETGTLELINGKAILAHPERCTGHAKCSEVCPTSAITLAVGGVRQTVRVPRVRENFETNVSNLYIVGELAGMGLIKTAINEGRLVVDHIKSMLGDTASSDGICDIAIVGAGPAGLSASLTALQHGLKYITLEQGDIASTIRQYPRQKFLMAEPIEMPLYGSLYVADGTKETLLGVWEAIVANTGVQVKTGERVESVVRSAEGAFLLTTNAGIHKARCVVLAMGKRGVPNRLKVPGAELAKVTYRLIEADSYENQDVLVVGGGDSAVEAALALSKSGRNRVTLSYRGSEFKKLRQRNLDQLEVAESSGMCRVLRNSHLREIRGSDVAIEVDGELTVLKNDFVIGLIGGESPEEFLRKVGVEIVEKTI